MKYMVPFAAAWLLSIELLAQGGVLADTGFEAPLFTTGPLEGQDGWSTVNGGAVTVSTLLPQTGTQALRIDGAGLGPVAGFPAELIAAYARREFSIDPVASGTPVVFIQASARLDGPSTNTGAGINDDLISTNIAALDGDGHGIAELILSSNGNAYAFGADSPYSFETPAAIGEYHTMGIRLNYLTRTADYLLDGRLIGTTPFADGVSNMFGSGVLLLPAFDTPALDTGLYSGTYDNVSIRAEVPEPAGVATLGVICAASLLIRRRRSTPRFRYA
jgi:hypothetical protein